MTCVGWCPTCVHTSREHPAGWHCPSMARRCGDDRPRYEAWSRAAGRDSPAWSARGGKGPAWPWPGAEDWPTTPCPEWEPPLDLIDRLLAAADAV
jgi:hypothetical protein